MSESPQHPSSEEAAQELDKHLNPRLAVPDILREQEEKPDEENNRPETKPPTAKELVAAYHTDLNLSKSAENLAEYLVPLGHTSTLSEFNRNYQSLLAEGMTENEIYAVCFYSSSDRVREYLIDKLKYQVVGDGDEDKRAEEIMSDINFILSQIPKGLHGMWIAELNEPLKKKSLQVFKSANGSFIVEKLEKTTGEEQLHEQGKISSEDELGDESGNNLESQEEQPLEVPPPPSVRKATHVSGLGETEEERNFEFKNIEIPTNEISGYLEEFFRKTLGNIKARKVEEVEFIQGDGGFLVSIEISKGTIIKKVIGLRCIVILEYGSDGNLVFKIDHLNFQVFQDNEDTIEIRKILGASSPNDFLCDKINEKYGKDSGWKVSGFESFAYGSNTVTAKLYKLKSSVPTTSASQIPTPVPGQPPLPPPTSAQPSTGGEPVVPSIETGTQPEAKEGFTVPRQLVEYIDSLILDGWKLRSLKTDLERAESLSAAESFIEDRFYGGLLNKKQKMQLLDILHGGVLPDEGEKAVEQNELGLARHAYQVEHERWRRENSKFQKILRKLGMAPKEATRRDQHTAAENAYIEARKKSMEGKTDIDEILTEVEKERDLLQQEAAKIVGEGPEKTFDWAKAHLAPLLQKYNSIFPNDPKKRIICQSLLTSAVFAGGLWAVGGAGIAGAATYGGIRFGKAVLGAGVGRTAGWAAGKRFEKSGAKSEKEHLENYAKKIVDQDKFAEAERELLGYFEERADQKKRQNLYKLGITLGAGMATSIGSGLAYNRLHGVNEAVSSSGEKGQATTAQEAPGAGAKKVVGSEVVKNEVAKNTSGSSNPEMSRWEGLKKATDLSEKVAEKPQSSTAAGDSASKTPATAGSRSSVDNTATKSGEGGSANARDAWGRDIGRVTDSSARASVSPGEVSGSSAAAKEAAQSASAPAGETNPVTKQAETPGTTDTGVKGDQPEAPKTTESLSSTGAKQSAEVTSSTGTPKGVEHLVEETKTNLSDKGFIQTMIDLRAKLRAKFPDPTKVPPELKHIYDTPSMKLAQEYGFWKPGQAAESGMGYKGETLDINANGQLEYHHLDGKTTIIDSGEHKFDGKMFHYEPKAARVSSAVHVAESQRVSSDIPVEYREESGGEGVPNDTSASADSQMAVDESGALRRVEIPAVESQSGNTGGASSLATPESVRNGIIIESGGSKYHLVDTTSGGKELQMDIHAGSSVVKQAVAETHPFGDKSILQLADSYQQDGPGKDLIREAFVKSQNKSIEMAGGAEKYFGAKKVLPVSFEKGQISILRGVGKNENINILLNGKEIAKGAIDSHGSPNVKFIPELKHKSGLFFRGHDNAYERAFKYLAKNKNGHQLLSTFAKVK